MTPVWMRARAQLRRRWAAAVVLAVLSGLAGGVVLAAVAGARRTEAAMGQFLAYNQSMNVFVLGAEVDLDAVRRLPQVAVSGSRYYMALVPPTPSGRPDTAAFGSVNPWAPASGPLWTELDRPLLVAGRHPDPARPLEVAVNERLAHQRRLRPGSTFAMWAYTPEQLRRARGPKDLGLPEGPAFRFAVTGIERQPTDLNPLAADTDVEYLGTQDLYLTPAFWRQYVGKAGAFDEPFLGLAPRIVDQISEIMVRINREGVAILFIEQHVERALALAHRGFVLESGRTVLEGRSAELLRSPEVRKVFLGG